MKKYVTSHKVLKLLLTWLEIS